METNDKEQKKKAEEAADKEKPTVHDKHHSSHGHSTGAESTAAGEPTLRSATTDSSRVPKSNNDEGPTGGNVR